MIIFYIICITAIVGGIYAAREKRKKSYYILPVLGTAMLLIGGIFSYQDSRPTPYYKLGTPISKVKSNDDAKSHLDGSYYTISGRNYVRYYSVGMDNKNLISTVKFNYYESDDENNVSHKQLLQDYKKVTADDLRETSTDHYYSKKTGDHYFSEEEYDGDSISQGIIHLAFKDLNNKK